MRKSGEIDGEPIYFVPEMSLHGLHVMHNSSGTWSVIKFDHTSVYDGSYSVEDNQLDTALMEVK